MKPEDLEQIVDHEIACGLGILADNQNAPVYEVAVGNIGFVYGGADRAEAERLYWYYMGESRGHRGRVAGEMVTLFENGDPIKEWAGDYGE